MSKQPLYGYPHVDDPNDFIPDPECSSPEERETHRVACANYGKPSYQPNKEHLITYDESEKLIVHIARTSWGIGTNLIDTCDDCGRMACETLMMCHECGGPEFCADCWPKHEINEHGAEPA